MLFDGKDCWAHYRDGTGPYQQPWYSLAARAFARRHNGRMPDMLDLLSMFSGSLRDGIPGLNAVVFEIANGFLVFSQRLEAFTVQRHKPYGGPPIGIDADPPEPQMETVTKHRVKFSTAYCQDLNAVREAQEIAKAELAKIATWRRDAQGKEGHVGLFG